MIEVSLCLKSIFKKARQIQIWTAVRVHQDITKKYEVQYADTKKFLEDLISEESRARRAKKKEAKIRKQQEEDAKLWKADLKS